MRSAALADVSSVARGENLTHSTVLSAAGGSQLHVRTSRAGWLIAVRLPPHRRHSPRVVRGNPPVGEHRRRLADVLETTNTLGIQHQLHVKPEPAMHLPAADHANGAS